MTLMLLQKQKDIKVQTPLSKKSSQKSTTIKIKKNYPNTNQRGKQIKLKFLTYGEF